jgi:hypothetical protein
MSENETETGNESEAEEETEAARDDDLLDAQEGKGYGGDEGEREDALDDDQ